MMQRNYHIAALISKFIRDDISEEEQLMLDEWLREDPDNQAILNSFRGDSAIQDINYLDSLHRDELWEALKNARSRRLKRRYLRVAGYAAAAALLVAFSWLGLFFSNQQPEQPNQTASSHYVNDVLPGGNKAQLVLSDGRMMDLTGGGLPELSEQNGTHISGGDGSIVYSAAGRASVDLIYNTLLIPEKGKYNLTLSDGTKVWLNALSSLRFPVLFNNQERSVTLKGEAYFEVAKDADRPFYVYVDETKIEVLGTHFNVNSYGAVKTTLFEGSVKMSNEADEKVLVPGQEGIVDEGITIQKANLQKTIAWKNDNFFFEGDNIREVMEQLSRWYGIRTVFRGNVQESMLYTGAISRNVNLSEVLETLTFLGNATFSIEEDQVTVAF